MDLHHIALGAHDVAGLADFYSDVFELDIVERHHQESGQLRSIWLRIGEGVLMIEKTAKPPRRVEGVGAGPFLLAFRVAQNEYSAITSQLADRGIAVENSSDFTSYFRDPEGNRVAVSHFPLALHATTSASDG